MEPAEKVALLALAYREFEMGSRDFGAPDEGAGDTSLLKKIASAHPLTEIDQLIIDSMDKVEELGALIVTLATFDALRYEALLHAWPPGPNNDPPPEEGFDRALFTPDRWHEVEHAMWELYAAGITHRPSFLNVIAEEAYAAWAGQMNVGDG